MSKTAIAIQLTKPILTSYKQTAVGIIPQDWEVKTLGDLVDKIIGGGTPSRDNSSYWNGDIPWATVKDLSSFNSVKTKEYPLGVIKLFDF